MDIKISRTDWTFKWVPPFKYLSAYKYTKKDHPHNEDWVDYVPFDIYVIGECYYKTRNKILLVLTKMLPNSKFDVGGSQFSSTIKDGKEHIISLKNLYVTLPPPNNLDLMKMQQKLKTKIQNNENLWHELGHFLHKLELELDYKQSNHGELEAFADRFSKSITNSNKSDEDFGYSNQLKLADIAKKGDFFTFKSEILKLNPKLDDISIKKKYAYIRKSDLIKGDFSNAYKKGLDKYNFVSESMRYGILNEDIFEDVNKINFVSKEARDAVYLKRLKQHELNVKREKVQTLLEEQRLEKQKFINKNMNTRLTEREIQNIERVNREKFEKYYVKNLLSNIIYESYPIDDEPKRMLKEKILRETYDRFESGTLYGDSLNKIDGKIVTFNTNKDNGAKLMMMVKNLGSLAYDINKTKIKLKEDEEARLSSMDFLTIESFKTEDFVNPKEYILESLESDLIYTIADIVKNKITNVMYLEQQISETKKLIECESELYEDNPMVNPLYVKKLFGLTEDTTIFRELYKSTGLLMENVELNENLNYIERNDALISETLYEYTILETFNTIGLLDGLTKKDFINKLMDSRLVLKKFK